MLKNLKHQNIVKYNGFIKTQDYMFIILEFCENGSLQSMIHKFGTISENLAAVYIYQVLYGLDYLHREGVIHRDIKGANILTTKEGRVKLGDFGVATRLSELAVDLSKQHAGDENVCGSPYWMAPEVIEMSALSPASDIWSVGCTIIELITGQPPFFGMPPMSALFKIVQEDHPPLPENISLVLRDLLLQCFQKNPAARSSARTLMKHPWFHNARNKLDRVPQNNYDYVDTNAADYVSDFDITDMKKLSIHDNDESLASHQSEFADSEDDDDFDIENAELDETALYFQAEQDDSAKISNEISACVLRLRLDVPDEGLIKDIDRLIDIFSQNPIMSLEITENHGAISMLTLMENKTSPIVLAALLKLIIVSTDNSVDLLENFCLLGCVPRILQLCESSEKVVKSNACFMLRRLYATNDLTRRIFVSCRGMDVLISLLDNRYKTDSDIVWIAVEGIYLIFKFQGSTTRNDFCHLLLQKEGIFHLVEIVHHLSMDRRTEAAELLTNVLEILYVVSRADNQIKELMSDSIIIRSLFRDFWHLSPSDQLVLLKCVKNLSSSPKVLDTIESLELEQDLIKIMGRPDSADWRNLKSIALFVTFQFCRLNRSRLEKVAICGIMKPLHIMIRNENQLKQLAISILCEMPHGSETCRKLLWQNDSLAVLLEILLEDNSVWQASALDAIFCWQHEDGHKVENILIQNENKEKLVRVFSNCRPNDWSALLVPYQELLTASVKLCKTLADSAEFMTVLLERITDDSHDVTARLNLFKILASVVESHDTPQAFSKIFDIENKLAGVLSESTKCPILVRKIATNIMERLK